MSKTRIEIDSLGELQIPQDALYGIQTQRAKENFPISGIPVSKELIYAYAQLKKVAAKVNSDLGKLDNKTAKEISEVCDEIGEGKHTKEFIVDVYQAGAGTSTNMNINEVIANRVLGKRGEKKGNYKLFSPNDIVNMSQSTNDTYPTAMRMAIVQQSDTCIQALKTLQISFEKQAKLHRKTITSARTHLQDAVPITLGQEFQSYADTIYGLLASYQQSVEKLKILGIGGSASGTGINTHPKYQEKMIQGLSEETGIIFQKNNNLIESMQSQKQIGEYSNTLATIAAEITRICNDIRLLASSENTGIGEIILPAVQPGSSIMPGKINPSIIECVNIVCLRVLGSRTSVEHCMTGGQLNLNIFMPLMSHECIESTRILTHALSLLGKKAIDGIQIRQDLCKQYAFESNGIFTALNPILGYHNVAKLVQEKNKTGKSLGDLLKENPEIDNEQIEKLLDPLVLSNIQ